MKGIKAIALAILFLSSTHVVRGQECENLRNANASDLVSFLSAATPDANNAICVAWAIKSLGNQQYAPSIPVLVKLLDFRRPLNEQEKLGLFLRPQSVWEKYPAAGALDRIGDKALPTLISAIKGRSASELARENATAVLMGIHKYEPAKGIALLRDEEANTNDDGDKQRLSQAISVALNKWCGPNDRTECEAAAHPKQP